MYLSLAARDPFRQLRTPGRVWGKAARAVSVSSLTLGQVSGWEHISIREGILLPSPLRRTLEEPRKAFWPAPIALLELSYHTHPVTSESYFNHGYRDYHIGRDWLRPSREERREGLWHWVQGSRTSHNIAFRLSPNPS